MKKIMNMTVADLVEMGANVAINFHGIEEKETARNKIEKFSSVGEIKNYELEKEKVNWFKIEQHESVEVSAFYDNASEESDLSTEYAQAELTEFKRGKTTYEQKRDEAGHTEGDFQ